MNTRRTSGPAGRTGRRRAAALAAAAALALGAAGCAGGSTGGTTNGSGPVQLTYRIWDKSQQPAMQHIVDAFQAANPSVKVTVQLTANAEYWTKLQADATSGSAPDVFWMNGPNAQLYASNGILMPLSDKLAANHVSLSDYPQSLVNLYSYKGTQYGVPKDFDTVGLWYNKKLFDAAGVKYPDDTWTWQTLQDAARKLTDASKDQYGILAPPFGQENYYDTIFQAGGSVISADGTSSGFDQPAAVAGLKFWTDLVKSGASPSLKTMTDTFPSQLFESGKVAMYYGGSWDTLEFAKNPNLQGNVDVAVLPQGTKRAVAIHGLANVAYAKTKHPKEAAAFLAFLGSKQAAEIEAQEGGVIPAFNSTQQSWVNATPQFHLQSFLDEVPYAVTYPTSKNTSAWQSQEAVVFGPAWEGTTDVATAAQKMAGVMNAALSKEK
ncbi:sugar ABC transporter substrate-binding protein [Kitasatospora paracochleata]|uniref:Multiple sugar transport system substrate-binding protein n=1 Tax=Kitasatospora paracochleata TaxID=58354 RepID=A0ABT1IW72_9ACTN|nr:sugar ABC transporter substrate-binding protein [Kitasatospora paracochleata]MCP2309393.1 multiple sugar transport system substrate-binding protein [Kitasatospora paracochleata]